MRKILLFILKISFSLGIILLLFLKADINRLYQTVVGSNYWYFLLAFVVTFLTLYLAALRWKILLRRFTNHILLFELFRFICLSLFYNFFVPGGFAGDIIRGYKCKNHYLSSTQGIASVFVERLIGLASFGIFGIFGIIFTFNILKQIKIVNIILVVFILFFIMLSLIFSKRIKSLFNFLENMRLIIFDKIKQLYDYIYYYKYHKVILLNSLIISLVISFANIAAFYLISISIGSDVIFIYFLYFVPIITIISYFPISYSGLGIREGGFVLLFAQVGMSIDQALAISLMYFGLLLILALLGGIIYFLTGLGVWGTSCVNS
jgi:uncharacterized protein (TIRG00374 family)